MRRAAERNGEALRQVVPVLLALARFADRAASLPFPVRFVLLVILRQAEAVIWPKVERVSWILVETGADGRAPYCLVRPSDHERRDSPADAMRLAYGFRLLSLIVGELASRLLAFASLPAMPVRPAAAARLGGASRFCGPAAHPAPDTS